MSGTYEAALTVSELIAGDLEQATAELRRKWPTISFHLYASKDTDIASSYSTFDGQQHPKTANYVRQYEDDWRNNETEQDFILHLAELAKELVP